MKATRHKMLVVSMIESEILCDAVHSVTVTLTVWAGVHPTLSMSDCIVATVLSYSGEAQLVQATSNNISVCTL